MRADIVREVWNPAPARPKPLTFTQYPEGWLAARTLEARTRGHYRRLLHLHLLPQLGDHQLARLSPQVVRRARPLPVGASRQPLSAAGAFGP